MSTFKDKTLMITGGTGSFGNTVLKHFLTTDIGQIRILSRDEKKQDDLRHELQVKYPEYADKVNKMLSSMRVSEDNGMDYTFVFDGGGNTEANVVSMTLTKDGSTTNYTKNEIPWQIGFVTPPGRLTRN